MKPAVLFTFGFLLICGCSDPVGPQPPVCDLACQIDKSPWPDAEAENIARYAENRLVAAESTYEKCFQALARWREQYAADDSAWCVTTYEGRAGWVINPTRISFFDPGTPGRFELYFYSDSFNLRLPDTLLTAGQPTGNPVWDSLNAFYRLDSLQVKHWTRLGIVLLTHFFHGRLDSKKISEAYDIFTGVMQRVYSPSIIGGISNCYPGIDSATGKINFLVDIGWGDCYCGCIYYAHCYFKQEENGDYEFVGKWMPEEPKPPWWSEAIALRQAWCAYSAP
ncbi:MAG: hypothetical protein V1668_03880 [Patescibacteria group bacterium]